MTDVKTVQQGQQFKDCFMKQNAIRASNTAGVRPYDARAGTRCYVVHGYKRDIRFGTLTARA